MLENELTKRIDDLLREELTLLGYEYRETIARLELTGDGEAVMIHFQGSHAPLEIARPEEDLGDDTLSAQLLRRLKVALEGPPPFAEPIEDYEG
jgi:hypothetical protein